MLSHYSLEQYREESILIKMIISAINLPRDNDTNLGPIQMDNLGPVVVIAGRNGAGKSRLLSKIWNLAKQYFNPKELQISIDSYSNIPSASEESAKLHQNEVNRFKNLLSITEQIIVANEKRPSIVHFTPKNLSLSDPNDHNKAEVIRLANSVSEIGMANLPGGVFAVIQRVQNKYFEATHPNKTISKEEAESSISAYEELKLIIFNFLGTKITRSSDGDAQLFGLNLGSCNLSDGQKVILQLCVAIFTQGKKLNDVVLFLDEPENHLHPAALIEMINVIRSHLTDGQIWIATHSIPLLAQVDPSEIWWMEDNTISKAGKNPEKVLCGLLGDEARRFQLARFLDLPFALASNRYAAECLIPPAVAPYKDNDPQITQIFKVLDKVRQNGKPLRILDVGAGKGRLAAELAASEANNSLNIDYYAFDPSQEDAEECRRSIEVLHGASKKRLFHEWSNLAGEVDIHSFDVIVMCNVLHEIHPSNWHQLFGTSGKICEFLKKEGFLLLVEVQQLSYGEIAHEHGFIVLDKSQLKKLFTIREEHASLFITDAQRDGWLKAHLIGRELLTQYTMDGLRNALKDLSQTAKEKISNIRQQGRENPYLSGRKHGFWVQQFANAELVLSSISA